MFRKLAISTLAALTLSSGAVMAAGAEGYVEDYSFSFQGPFGAYDQAQLQRGLQVFTEVCSACHGLQYVPYRAMTDEDGLGYSEDQVRAYAAQFEIFDPAIDDWRTATPNDHFGGSNLENAPDLSLMAKARAGFSGPYGLGINQFLRGMGGPEYIASLLTHYTGEEVEQFGSYFYENDTFGLIAMAPPLWDGQVEYADGSPNDIESMALDVSAFLMWAAEPNLMDRKRMGFTAFILLGLLAARLYLTNKRLWAPVKARAKGQQPAE